MENEYKIKVKASGCYDILIRPGSLDNAGEKAAAALGKCKLAILSDSNVFPLYGERVCLSLEKAGFKVCHYEIPAGEASKNLDELRGFIDFMARNGLTRTDAAVALGGGVVGDMAGFAAAIYMRGIRYMQIPTTLLAAVDSSVGGKTAVDIDAGKNLIGAFHQPSVVLCDPLVLDTLAPLVLRDGYAEVIKYGVILDRELFDMVAEPGKADVTDIIARCISIKRDVVQADEFDRGMRGLLNFGHTFGHAIEKLSGYTTSHGSAVAKGMVTAARIGAELGMSDCTEAITSVVRAYGFDTGCSYTADELYHAALSDKKRSGDDITLVLPREVGRCELVKMPADRLRELLKTIAS